MRRRSWTDEQLAEAVKYSVSFRQIIIQLGLRPAGGNYQQLKIYVREQGIDTSHLKGRGWNKGMKGASNPRIPLTEILKKDRPFQSYKLKKRLFSEGLKSKECEECGWARETSDGYLPLELDHINGDHWDNRIENLRVLCPNCHSLKPTHRGRKRKINLG